MPLSIQPRRNRIRSSRSTTHDARGLRDGYDGAFSHSTGTLLANMSLPTCSKISDMTTVPLIALVSSLSDSSITGSRRLYLMISCCSTVFIDSS